MSMQYDFNNLFVFDLANNHQGSVSHGQNIIRGIGEVAKRHGVRAAFKFQFRHLATMIHPDFRTRKDIPHVPRFLETQLSADDFKRLAETVNQCGMITMATPFDEPSVGLLKELNIEILKIASCSANDWPLLEEAVLLRKPIVISTAGISLESIDRVYDFMKSHGSDFAFMHCVAVYPTPAERMNLNQVGILKKRYPDITIGYSTHESPDYLDGIKMAFALGARIFERHVGMKTDTISLNAYSSTPEQIDGWLVSYADGVKACGGEFRAPADEKERESLRSLMRGVYAKEQIEKGGTLSRSNVYFAMPLQEGQMKSGEWRADVTVDRMYKKQEALPSSLATSIAADDQTIIRQIIDQARAMLNEARIIVGDSFKVELSHHYGLQRFREFGAVIIDCINRSYAKKFIIQLPRQKHPYHHHRKKEETFHVLFGDLEIEIDGHRMRLKPGDVLTVMPNQWHKFQTMNGVIFEEVSTTHYANDSFYDDERIQRQTLEQRKTRLVNWNPEKQ